MRLWIVDKGPDAGVPYTDAGLLEWLAGNEEAKSEFRFSVKVWELSDDSHDWYLV